jgi:hypothetical protein
MQPRGVSTVIGTPRPREEAAVAGEVEAAAAAGDGEAAADDEAGAVRGRCAAEEKIGVFGLRLRELEECEAEAETHVTQQVTRHNSHAKNVTRLAKPVVQTVRWALIGDNERTASGVSKVSDVLVTCQ